MIWTCCCNPLWKFSKIETSFANQVSCLKFVSNQLQNIISSGSPVANLLQLPEMIENHQKNIGMPLAKDSTDGHFGSETTKLFVKFYEVSSRRLE